MASEHVRRRWIIIIAASALVAAGVLAWRLWPKTYPRASVVEYRVLQDDTAFLLRTRVDLFHESPAWLSRVDSSGHTKWVRQLPALPLLGQALHVTDDVVAVRYTHRRDGYERGHSIVAYSHAGKRLSDKTIAPFYPQPVGNDPRYGKTPVRRESSWAIA